MELREMPLGGRWKKLGEGEWLQLEQDGVSKVMSRLVPDTQRRRIDEMSRKRYGGNNRQRRRYEVGRQKYHTHTRLKEELRSLSQEFPDLASVYSIGLTASGREILVIKICAGVSLERPLLRPQIKIIGGIHGDEVVGRELLLYLARALCEQFSSDSAITELLSSTEIHLLPSLNTDGYILKTRNNANDKDLNRSFPDWAHLGESWEARLENREPETAAVMTWLSLHDGWTMVIFPWDDSPACSASTNAVTSEDSVFYALAQAYAHHHRFMHTGKCPCHPEPLPIGNYRDEEVEVVEGGMGDYSYMYHGCLEFTIEISCDKRPHSKTLTGHWDDNYPSLLTLLGSVHTGVRGLTLDSESNILAGVSISVRGLEREVRSNERGEYWILLLPGDYSLKAEHCNQFGTLATEVTISLVSYLGEGARTEHLVLTPRYTPRFTLSRYLMGQIENILELGDCISRE